MPLSFDWNRNGNAFIRRAPPNKAMDEILPVRTKNKKASSGGLFVSRLVEAQAASTPFICSSALASS